jgi:hypothetical protein
MSLLRSDALRTIDVRLPSAVSITATDSNSLKLICLYPPNQTKISTAGRLINNTTVFQACEFSAALILDATALRALLRVLAAVIRTTAIEIETTTYSAVSASLSSFKSKCASPNMLSPESQIALPPSHDTGPISALCVTNVAVMLGDRFSADQ